MFRTLPTACYKPENHGNLEQYLLSHRGGLDAYPLFHGYKWFQEILKKGYFIPGYSAIRIGCGVGADEHYEVTKEYKLYGIGKDTSFPGKPGVHDPRKLIRDNGMLWEAQHLDRKKIEAELAKRKGVNKKLSHKK